MWKGIRELVDLLLLWGFWYLGKEIKRFEKLMSQTEVQEYLESVLTSCKNSFTNAA